MINLKRLFRTRCRIVTDGFAGYEVQTRYWFWPFWCQYRTNTHSTIEDAEAYARERMHRFVRGRMHRFVKEVSSND